MTAEADRSARSRSTGRFLLRAAVLVAAFLALVAFSVVLAKVTLTPSPASEDIVTSNMKPGRSLRQYAEDYTFLAACKQAGGNLLLGAPFGVLLPILVPRRLRMLRMALLTVLVMAVVELIQGALVAGRAFDIDDVILNTSGALLGYLVVGRRVSHRFHALSDEPAPAKEAKPAPRTPDRAEPGSRSKTKPAAGPGFASKVKSGMKARSGTRTKSGTKAKPAASSRSQVRAKLGRKAEEPAARRSASAPVPRGRALVDRWRGRREEPGGGAPGARRSGVQ
ncbi:VanZ family protein [Streptomyces sp. NPDC102402]|uniref:VanZ family protein n=1 Tax=Streptomyces sp. NPDC102402 TaxID=3366169 RepID=UPI003822623F